MTLAEAVQHKTDKALLRQLQSCKDDAELTALIDLCEGTLQHQGISTRLGHFTFDSLHELIEAARRHRTILRQRHAVGYTERWGEILEQPFTVASQAHHHPEKRHGTQAKKGTESGGQPAVSRERKPKQRSRRGKQSSGSVGDGGSGSGG